MDCLKKTWKGLKDNYRSCNDRREKATRSGAAATSLPTCKYFKQLQFLKHTVIARDTDTNLDAMNEQETQDMDVETREDVAFTAEPAVHVNQAIKEASGNNDDPDALFCKSLISRLRELPTKKKSWLG